jgi:hypothetical protein
MQRRHAGRDHQREPHLGGWGTAHARHRRQGRLCGNHDGGPAADQFLAQLKTPDTIASIKSKQVGNLDLDAFIDALNQLHSLDGYTSVLGDPKAAIDYYVTVAKAAKVLFATDPMTQAAIDTYNTNIVSVSDFLGRQVAISGAIGQAGC